MVQDDDMIPLLIACIYRSHWMFLELEGGFWERETLPFSFLLCYSIEIRIDPRCLQHSWFTLGEFWFHQSTSEFQEPLSLSVCSRERGPKYLEVTLISLLGLTIPSTLPSVTPAGAFLPFQGSLLNNKVFNGHRML